MGGARFEPKRKEILITGDNWMLPGVGIYKKKDFKRKERKYGLGQENKKETKILTKKKRKKTRSLPRKKESNKVLEQ